MSVDPAILKLLNVDTSSVMQSRLGTGFSSTFRVIAKAEDGNDKSYFLKTGSGDEAQVMFAGEHASLAALNDVVQGLAPRSLGHGKLSTSDKSFLLTEWLDTSARGTSRGSLAPKLARLHTTPAPAPDGFDKPQFGFSVKTCCGSTPQRNEYTDSWSRFYARHRLGFILEQSLLSQRVDSGLQIAIERICREVVPRLLGDQHLNNGNGVVPVVVHGDLWSGNASTGILPGMSEPQEVIFDSSACYAHSEYELGIMKMFGGFGKSFMDEYHKLCPKTEPVSEYDDRVALYELYHHLNHFSMFGGSYRSGAMSIMDRLLTKYGNNQDTPRDV